MPAVAERTGIDLNPLDATSAEDRDWLRALVWPEHEERRRRLMTALEIVSEEPPRLLAANALDALPGVIDGASAGSIVTIFHCHVLNQFPVEAKAALEELLLDAGRTRPIVRIAEEGVPSGDAALVLHTYEGGEHREEQLATVQPHGAWLRWEAE
jgi:hypothetical protein